MATSSAYRSSVLPPQASRLRRAVLAALLVALALVGAGVPGLGADEADRRDVLNEYRVRTALAKDPRLEPLNLMVRVKNQVATLSGPVPSRELAQRAVQTAGMVPEVHEVRDKMTVQFEDAGLLLPLPVTTPKARMPDRIKLTPIAPPPNVAQNPKQNAPPAGTWKPVYPEAVKKPTKDVALSIWIPSKPSEAEAVSLAKEATPSKVREPSDAAAISSAIQSLLQGEERFRRLRFEVKQGQVFLSGVVHRWADLQELARAATHIPGVEGVVLRDVKTELPRR